MTPQAKQPETLIARDIRLFRRNVAVGFARANRWRRRAVAWVEARLDTLADWEQGNKRALLFGLALLIFIGLTIWFLMDWSRGKVGGDAVQTGVGGLIGGALLSLPLSLIISLLALLTIFLANKLFKVLTPVILFLPAVVWTLFYALWQVVVIVLKLLLLVPLFALFIVTRLWELWRGIFYTCPSRHCSYRGLPIYVCPKCSEGNPKLWPNLYGVLWHHCVNCDKRLPTLDLRGRNKLQRRCGGCKIPLLGNHSGRAPERLVALVGGINSGKTNYLLMAVNEIINGIGDGSARIHGEIDDPTQAETFRGEWLKLTKGLPADKTAEVPKAFLLYIKAGKERCQLYLYDAPGDEFSSISAMTRQQYFPLLEGFILLVDPLSFEPLRRAMGIATDGGPSLQEVVASTLATAAAGAELNRHGRIAKRVAVVISKADLDPVKAEIGDVTRDCIAGERCRAALINWGGENALRAIEHRFEEVAYFACSPLGRAAEQYNRQPFQGAGIVEPLAWVLTGRRL